MYEIVPQQRIQIPEEFEYDEVRGPLNTVRGPGLGSSALL